MSLGRDEFLRRDALLQLLQQFLREQGWGQTEIEPDRTHRSVLRARFGSAAGCQTLTIVMAGDAEGVGSVVTDRIVIHDDAISACPRRPLRDGAGWLDMSMLAALSVGGGGGSGREARLGRDLLFPFLRPGRGSNLRDYASNIRRRYGSETGRFKRLYRPTASIVKCGAHSRTESNASDIKAEPSSIEDIFQTSKHGGRVLIAVHEADEAPELVRELFFRRHVEELHEGASDGQGEGIGDLPPTRLPLFLSAEDIWALGYPRTLREELWRASRYSFTAEMIRQMARTGFLHVYLPNLERLRLDVDLDPNTQFVCDFLANAGQWGGFTLGCQRYQIFHFPTFVSQEAAAGNGAIADAPWLRTLGDRFAFDQSLVLYDLGRPTTSELEQLGKDIKDTIADWSESTARLSEARITLSEALHLLRALAIREVERNGGLIPRSDLGGIIAEVSTGERRRPEHIAYIESALLGSGALRLLDSGHIVLASSFIGGALIASHIGTKLREASRTKKWSLFDPILAISRLPYWVMRWGIPEAKFSSAEELREAAKDLLVYNGIARPSDARDASQRENLINFLLAGMDYFVGWSVDGGHNEPDDFLAGVAGVKVTGISLPQRVFSNLTLDNWSFKDCNLRGSMFVDCRMQGAEFDDCFLGGARFLRCDFGGSEPTSFRGSDLSGAIFVEAGSLAACVRDLDEGRLENVNFSSAYIKGDGTNSRFVKRLRKANCLTLGLDVYDTSIGKFVGGAEDQSPAFYECLARHAWIDHCGGLVVRVAGGNGRDDDDEAIVVRSDVLTSDRFAKGWPETMRPLQLISADVAEHQVLLALDDRGRLWTTVLGSEAPHWREALSVGGAELIAARMTSSGLAVAIAARGPGGASLTIFLVVDADSDSPQWHRSAELAEKDFFDRETSAGITALRWLGDAVSQFDELGLAIGMSNGALLVFHQDEGWRRQSSTLDVRARVEAIGYSNFNSVMVIAHADGQTLGYRRSESETLTPLFKFHSAQRQIYDIVVLGQFGKIIILGSEQPLDVRRQNKALFGAAMLCILLNTNGNVLAVFPRSPEPLQATQGKLELAEGHNRAKRQSRSPGSAQEMGIRRAVERLNRYQPKNQTVTFRPAVDVSLTLTLTCSSSGDELAESVLDGALRRFRMVKVETETDDGFRQIFDECDLEIRQEPNSFTVTLPIAFTEAARSAKAELTIGYLAVDGRTESCDRKWVFGVDIERLYNPFTADGSPVVGEQFFGLSKLLDECINHMMERRVVIVCSRRRAGKTSFFLEASRLVARHKVRAVDRMSVVVSGEQAAGGEGLIPAIADQVERMEGLAPEYKGLAEVLRRSGRAGYNSDGQIIRLEALAKEIANRGIPLPLVVFIDEWGLICKRRLPGGGEEYNEGYVASFMDQVEKLKRAGVSICLTSVPSDFPPASSNSESNPYRYVVDPWLEIQPLDPSECRTLITRPLERIQFDIEPDAVDRVIELSSCIPDDANRIMHYALSRAREQFENEKGAKRITLEHIMAADPVDRLLRKYRDQLPPLFQPLTREQKDILYEWAGQDHEKPHWERTEVQLPTWRGAQIEAGAALELRIGNAGYRVRASDPKLHKLWLPYGLTLAIREDRAQSRK